MTDDKDIVEKDKLCPYCKGSLLDNIHMTDRVRLGSYYSYIIGCPQHPKGSFMIGTFEDAR